ncbi:unnamed protein product [Arabis nemorensis]|uniref:Uncharacterized protein n=1 Tax=Arabis nemorensis TaxID=586526 RepID=A0A565CIS1_9BRAS|nr:unnamed protein product [Arabis nemorensis]
MATLEKQDTKMATQAKEKGKASELDTHSKVGEEGDGSKTPDAVVRNPKVGAKIFANVESAVEKKKNVAFIDMTKEKSEVEKYGKPDVKSHKKTVVEFFDMTKDVTPTPKGKHPSPVPTYSDLQEEKVNKTLGGALNKLLDLTKNDDFGVLKRRKMTLAKTQVDPFIGNSETLRIMYGETPSPAVYDLFAPVDKSKLDRLLAYVKTDLENPFDNSLAGVELYLGIMTPKHLWPADNPSYGWLSTGVNFITSHTG